MLATCHERVRRMLTLQAKLQQQLLDQGCDEPARQAARDVMRYFDIAAPLHHQDEELHVFPPLAAGPEPPCANWCGASSRITGKWKSLGSRRGGRWRPWPTARNPAGHR
jgi:Hemerythrin HHE cation binding domain